MVTVEALKQYGANVEEGIARCAGSEALYLRLVGMIKNEKSFGKLADAIAENDLEKAFEASHAMKGVLGNLSLTPLYEKSSEITELLRARKEADYPALLRELQELKQEFDSLFD